MLPYTAYDIIRTVNREVDLTRPPVREFHHTFGADPGADHDEPGGGGGFPVSRGRLGGLRAVFRFFGSRSPRAVGQPMG